MIILSKEQMIVLHAPFQSFDGIGAHAMLVFLALNGIELDDTQDELADTFLDIAAGQRSLMSCWDG